MQIVIDISEKLYTRAGCDEDILYDDDAMIDILDAICGGKILPEHHGRLIDADALMYKQTHHGNYCIQFELIGRNDLSNAPTIIEADKESEE